MHPTDDIKASLGFAFFIFLFVVIPGFFIRENGKEAGIKKAAEAFIADKTPAWWTKAVIDAKANKEKSQVPDDTTN